MLVNKTYIKEVAKGKEVGDDEQVLKIYAMKWKTWNKKLQELRINDSEAVLPRERCDALFCETDLSDKAAGGINLAIALVVMFICLFFIVKILNSIFRGSIAKVVHKFVNAGCPGKFRALNFLIGYLALLVGCGMTILVQSSSIFTSTLTPLVGLNIIGIERAFPMTLGANIGTTVTGFLAALTSDDNFENALTISLCHLLFNIFGILIWYPIPFMRKIPLGCAKQLGKVTKKYKWFAFAYIIFVFVILPGIIFALSLAGEIYVGVFCGIIILIILAVVILKLLQKYVSSSLPPVLRDFKFLPTFLRSLEPYHNGAISLFNMCLPEHKKMEKRRKESSDSSATTQSTNALSSPGGVVMTGRVMKKNDGEFEEPTDQSYADTHQVNLAFDQTDEK